MLSTVLSFPPGGHRDLLAMAPKSAMKASKMTAMSAMKAETKQTIGVKKFSNKGGKPKVSDDIRSVSRFAKTGEHGSGEPVLKRPSSAQSSALVTVPEPQRKDRNKDHHFQKHFDDLPDYIKESYLSAKQEKRREIVNQLLHRDEEGSKWLMDFQQPMFKEFARIHQTSHTTILYVM